MRIIASFILITVMATSCNNSSNEDISETGFTREQLAEINRQLIIKDRERIIAYIDRKGLQMQETETGLWIPHHLSGDGEISDGDIISLSYTCSLLDGTLLYDSDKDGIMKFEVGKSDIPAGLNEAVKYLNVNDKAMFILPGYLAYGLLGDEKKIPARSVLVYDIKVLNAE